MEAGRELDALIAEKVMGWNLFAGEPGYGRRPNKFMSLILDPIPHYSTNIEAAWLVVEKIHAGLNPARMGTYNYLTLVCTGTYSGWAASFDFNLGDEWWEADVIVSCPFAARGHTAELAICLAALKAMNVEMPE